MSRPISSTDLPTTSTITPLWRGLSLLLWPLAILWRCQNWAGVFYGKEVFLYSTDPYYHLRRVCLTLQNFPHVPDIDPFLNFPDSAATHWPFAFDLFAAGVIQLLSKICGQDPQDPHWIMTCSALMPPILGGLLAGCTYRIARELMPLVFAGLAGLITAWLPAAIHYSQLGNFDHHWWAALCQALFLIGYCQSYRLATNRLATTLPTSPEVAQPTALASAAYPGWQYFLSTLLAAFAITLALLGATEFPLILVTHCLFIVLAGWRLPDQRRQLVRTNLFIFGQTSLLLLPFVFTRYFEPHGVSPLLGCAWLGITAITWLLLATAVYQKTYSYWLGIVGLLLTGLLLLFFDFSLIKLFLAEFYRSQGNTALARFIAENRPVLQYPLGDILWWQSALLLLVPVTLYRLWQQATPNTLLLFVNLLIIEPLSLAHERFSVLATIPLVVSTVYYLANIWPQTAGLRPVVRPIAFATGVLLLLLPSLQRVNFATTQVVQSGFLPLYEPLKWLARHTPPPINPASTPPLPTSLSPRADGSSAVAENFNLERSQLDNFNVTPANDASLAVSQRPLLNSSASPVVVAEMPKPSLLPASYGVLTTDWGIGHWLVHYGGRPTLASPLLHTTALANAVTISAQILTAPPLQAIPQMEARHLKYLFFTYQEFSYLLELQQHPAAQQSPAQWLPLLSASLYGQVLLNYGVRNQMFAQHTLDRLRLVYEAPTTRAVAGNTLPTCLILELVAGVQLQGKATPGSTVNIRTTLITNNGRNILYQRDLITDTQGYFTIHLPYATGNNGAVTAAPYSLAYDGQEKSLTVTATQVQQGVTLQLSESK
jgi:asparagine N-glycosylation enzyme membrane subunit Stt3